MSRIFITKKDGYNYENLNEMIAKKMPKDLYELLSYLRKNITKSIYDVVKDTAEIKLEEYSSYFGFNNKGEALVDFVNKLEELASTQIIVSDDGSIDDKYISFTIISMWEWTPKKEEMGVVFDDSFIYSTMQFYLTDKGKEAAKDNA